MSAVPELPLDPAITRWVLVPIFVAMFVIAVLQDNLRVLLLSGANAVPIARQRRDQLLLRAARLRANGAVLPDERAWHRRRAFFTNAEAGALTARLREGSRDGMLVRMTMMMFEQWGPGAGSAMLKQYALNLVPTILLGVFVNHFFSGFIAAKLPFSPPASFRYMLHTGIALPELDACYVSSLSWYFLSLFGVRSLAALVTDWMQSGYAVQLQEVPSQSPIMSTMLLGLGGAGGPSEDQLLQAECDNLHVTQRDATLLGEAEVRLQRM